MSALDKTIPPLALNLINKYGTSCVLTTTVPGTYNPATSKVEGTVINSQDVKGLVEEYADNLRFLGDKTEPKNSIVEGDKKVSVAASGLKFIPAVGDKIAVGAALVVYEIIGVGSLWSGELVAVYVLHVSKR